jgi:hypothetical protein
MGDKPRGAIAALLVAASCGSVVLACVSAWAHVRLGVTYSLIFAAALMISGLKLWNAKP